MALSATSTLNRHTTPPQYGLYQLETGTTGSKKSKTASLKSRTNSAPSTSTGASTPMSNNYKYFNDNIIMSSPMHHGTPGGSSSSSMTLTGVESATMLRDYRNPMLTTCGGGEMSLRQFSTVSELLTKLRADLRFSFPR